MSITYPPEMLPSPDEGEEAEVVVVDPDTGRRSVVSSDDAADASTRMEALARIPQDQQLTWTIAPHAGRLLFADTVGKSLIAMKDIFKSIGDELGRPQVVCISDARFDANGALSFDLVVMPKEGAKKKHSTKTEK